MTWNCPKWSDHYINVESEEFGSGARIFHQQIQSQLVLSPETKNPISFATNIFRHKIVDKDKQKSEGNSGKIKQKHCHNSWIRRCVFEYLTFLRQNCYWKWISSKKYTNSCHCIASLQNIHECWIKYSAKISWFLSFILQYVRRELMQSAQM